MLSEELSRLGLSYSADIERELETYIGELERWKERINLTALHGRDLYRRLVAEPSWIGQQLQMSGALLDLGSGNGSPGIPLLVSCRLKRVHLVESRLKRAVFLRHLATRLPSGKRMLVQKSRLEDMTSCPDDIEWVTLQGVKPVDSLVATLKRLFRSTTRVVWITAGTRRFPAGENLVVPGSRTVASVLQLDQF
ncbi:MAG TPA: RsmG family class I SAM-dependent methyltransferase [Terriglobia bacterium]|nr:RsmG family class I SAM-dependent methyltransferase [Terriglobia bacterium]